MKVKDLIVLLQSIPQNADVFIWHDGDCHELHDGINCLDLSEDGTNVQINAKNSVEYING